MNLYLKLYRFLMHDSLRRNSIYLIASTFVLAVLGFVFWVVAARIFDAEKVGSATTLISIMTLISGFSMLGTNMSLVRYLPKSNRRNEIINSALILTAIASVMAGGIFLIGLSIFSPKLLYLWTNMIYIISFLLFMIAMTWNTLFESIFMAYRASGNILVKNILQSILKLIFPFFLISYGAYGLYSSVSAALVVSCIFSVAILVIRFKFLPRPLLNINVVTQMARFSVGNYIAGFLYQIPTLVLPIFIANILHLSSAAYFYVDSMILNFLIIIPIATTQSLLTEGSYDDAELKKHITKAVELMLFLLIPAVCVMFFFGNIILNVFGKSYEQGAFVLLRLLILSSFFTSISLLGSSIMRIKHKIGLLILSNLAGAILTIVSCFLFISQGLVGIGWGWLIGQGLMGILFLVLILREL